MYKRWVIIEIGGIEAGHIIRRRRPSASFIRKYWPNAVALEIQDCASRKIGFTFI